MAATYLPDIPGSREISASFPWADLVEQIGDSVQSQMMRSSDGKGPSKSLSKAARELQSKGRGGDTILAHINPQEAAILRAIGGSGTINPDTGLPEYWSLKSFVKSVVKIAAPVVGFAYGGPAGAAAASAAATKLTGGSNQEALFSAATSYIGASMSTPAPTTPASAGVQNISIASQNAANAGAAGSLSGTVNAAAAPTLSSAVSSAYNSAGGGVSGFFAGANAGIENLAASAVQPITNALPATVQGASVQGLKGIAQATLLGNAAMGIGEMIGAQKMAAQIEEQYPQQPQQTIDANSVLNDINTIKINLPGEAVKPDLSLVLGPEAPAQAINYTPVDYGDPGPGPTGASSSPVLADIVQAAQTASGIPEGVNMLDATYDRETGRRIFNRTPYNQGIFSSAVERGRRSGWGSNVMFV